MWILNVILSLLWEEKSILEKLFTPMRIGKLEIKNSLLKELMIKMEKFLPKYNIQVD